MFLLVFEKKIVGTTNYLPFSPLFIFIAAYNLVFVLPTLLVVLPIGDVFYMSRLDASYLGKYTLYNRCFFYIFCLLSILYFDKGKKISKKNKLKKSVDRSWVVYLILLAFIAKFLYLGTGLGFNPLLILDRIIFPREYTKIKIGTGFINYIQASLTLLAYFMAALLYQQKGNKVNLLLMIFSAILFFVGGAKQQVIWLAFVYIMLKNKNSDVVSFALMKNLKYLILISGLVVFSFAIMIVRADNKPLIEKLVKYQRESYYSALVITDFEWKSEYSVEGVVDTLTAPIPRALWQDKPFIGYYNRYWRDKYEPKTVRFHTSTYGFIAESHMLLSSFGAVVYSIFFFFLVKYCYTAFLKSTTYIGVFFPIYLTTLLYFFLRSGFTGFTLLTVISTYLISTIVIRKTYKFIY